MEDSTTLGPVSLHTSGDQVLVTGHEEEMIIDELLADFLIHAFKGVVGSSEVSGQLLEGFLHQILDLNALFLGDARGQTESGDAAANADPKIRSNI